MIKKNASERRFNTAAARIMMTGKLPSDFFLPSRQKEGRESSLYSHRQEDVEGHHITETHKKDPLLFTFHRSRSQEQLKIRKVIWPGQNASPKLFAPSHPQKQQTKLPPVSMVIAKENINDQWFKVLGPNKDKLKKLGRISNRFMLNDNIKQEKGEFLR